MTSRIGEDNAPGRLANARYLGRIFPFQVSGARTAPELTAARPSSRRLARGERGQSADRSQPPVRISAVDVSADERLQDEVDPVS